MLEQVLPQFLLVVQLRARKEDFHQAKTQLDSGLSEEERGDSQWPVWDQSTADRGGVDAGHCAPWHLCQGKAPVVFHQLPDDRSVDLDDVVYIDKGQADEHTDGERCTRHYMLDKRLG